MVKNPNVWNHQPLMVKLQWFYGDFYVFWCFFVVIYGPFIVISCWLLCRLSGIRQGKWRFRPVCLWCFLCWLNGDWTVIEWWFNDWEYRTCMVNSWWFVWWFYGINQETWCWTWHVIWVNYNIPLTWIKATDLPFGPARPFWDDSPY